MAGGDPLKKLAAQVGDVDKRVHTVEETVDGHTETLGQVLKTVEEILHAVKHIQTTQSALASSVGLAMTELAIARSLEKRVERLEAAVFPPKH